MIKPLCVDEFGTQWFLVSRPGFVTRKLPAQVLVGDLTTKKQTYMQPACLEAWCDWGLVDSLELTELGFKLRW